MYVSEGFIWEDAHVFVKVGKKTLYSAKQSKDHWLAAGEYTPLVRRVQIRRSRKPIALQENVIRWLEDHSEQSSNSKNLVKYKDENNVKQEHIVQWRDESLAGLFKKCKLEITHGDLLKRTYFYNAVPSFIKVVRPAEAVCPYHMAARKWTKELKRKRLQWHGLCDPTLVCVCACVFCSPDGCNHGKNPDGEGPVYKVGHICANHKCNRCKDSKCPAEWTNEPPLAVWYTTTITKRLGGGNSFADKQHTATRKVMMGKWLEEMKGFEKHEERVAAVKTKVDWLKRNLPVGHILIKGDFIQNITHSRGVEPPEAYYNKRQTQLLTFVVWHHTAESTPEKPDIKMDYYDYLSGYLRHTSLFFQKCFSHLIQYLKENLPQKLRKVQTNCKICELVRRPGLRPKLATRQTSEFNFFRYG